MSTKRIHEQVRAEDALAKVKLIRGTEDKYGRYVNSLPASIVMNGLGQAMATEASSKGEHKKLYDNLSTWLCGEDGPYRGGSDLLDSIVKNGQEDYLRAQAEALAWLNWHKKFCRAYLKRDGDRSD